jgi:Nuclease A inhibitor-like protein
MKSDPILDALHKAAQSLLFPSETDAPLQPFVWQDGNALTARRVLQLSGVKAATAIEETTLAELLLTVPSEDRARFHSLQNTLETLLAGIKVYKVGAGAEKTVYIVGQTTDGRWAGLRTLVVET